MRTIFGVRRLDAALDFARRRAGRGTASDRAAPSDAPSSLVHLEQAQQTVGKGVRTAHGGCNNALRQGRGRPVSEHFCFDGKALGTSRPHPVLTSALDTAQRLWMPLALFSDRPRLNGRLLCFVARKEPLVRNADEFHLAWWWPVAHPFRFQRLGFWGEHYNHPPDVHGD